MTAGISVFISKTGVGTFVKSPNNIMVVINPIQWRINNFALWQRLVFIMHFAQDSANCRV